MAYPKDDIITQEEDKDISELPSARTTEPCLRADDQTSKELSANAGDHCLEDLSYDSDFCEEADKDNVPFRRSSKERIIKVPNFSCVLHS